MILLVCLLLTVGTVLPTKTATNVANMSIPGYSELLTGYVVVELRALLVPKLVKTICISLYYGRMAARLLRDQLKKTRRFEKFQWIQGGAMFSAYFKGAATPQDAATYLMGSCGSLIYGSISRTSWPYNSSTVGCSVVVTSEGFLPTCYLTLQDYRCENKP